MQTFPEVAVFSEISRKHENLRNASKSGRKKLGKKRKIRDRETRFGLVSFTATCLSREVSPALAAMTCASSGGAGVAVRDADVGSGSAGSS